MPRLLGISGSLRSASANSGLVRCAQAHAVKLDGVEWVTADIGSLPLYNQDLEDGCEPAEVALFRQQVRDADAIFFACPEYNYNVTAALKNALDWASRPNVWQGKAAAVVGAGGGSGTARAQLALRQSGVFLDLTFVNAPEVAIKRFEEKCFDEATGDLISDKWSERIREMVERLLRLEGLLHVHDAATDLEPQAPKR